MNNLIDKYTQLESILALANLEVSVSEVHGTLVGAIANHLKSSITPDLLNLVVPNASPADYQPLQEHLYELYRDTSESLLSGEEDFDLFLHDDDNPLNVRIDDLAAWCRGYLLGLLYNNAFSIDQLTESGPEIARDIMQISEADATNEQEQQDEWALAELHEYVKVGVQLIFECIYTERAADTPAAVQ